MNEELNSALEKGENLLWSGRAGDFTLFVDKRKSQILKSIVISLVVTLAVIAGYLLAIKDSSADVMPALIIIIALFGAYAAFTTVLDARKVRKQIYAVTDRRILVMTQGQVSSVAYDNLGEHTFCEEASGYKCFVAGSDMKKYDDKKLIKFASLGIRTGEDGACTSLVLFAINEPELFTEAVTPFLK